MPPTAMDRLPREPESIDAVRDRLHGEAFREGLETTIVAVAVPALSAAAGATSLGHDGPVLVEATGAVGSTVANTVRGQNLLVAGASAYAEYLASLAAHAAAGGAGTVALQGATLTAESLAHGLRDADEIRDAGHRLGTWQRAREAAGRAAQSGRVDGRNDVMRADLSDAGLPRTIDHERMRVDGDYARAVLAACEERLATGRY
jgi:hypothetical protein